ncbi:MAG: hypothetical protein WAP45_11085 [Limnochordia bacterium]|jgi:hypothetical protein|nr:hypothetical protein [Limnochordia bacterium]HPU65967.1 hypothetical protein [Limnochordia bacterium]
MEMLLLVTAVVALALAVQYLLYINGFLVIRAISALVFFSPVPWWGTAPRARVKACTGFVRKVIKFKESRTYHFSFSSEVSKGSITAEIQGRNKETLLVLDGEKTSDVLDVQSGERYYLVVRFKRATGSFELSWS